MKIHVRSSAGNYPVWIEMNCLSDLGNRLGNTPTTTGVAVITDDHVWELHGERFLKSFGSETPPAVISFPPGESSKNLETLARLLDQLDAAGLDRNGMIISFGGGVVGDVAGFTAAVFKRGVPVFHIPTTLLAQVDAAIGGKTGLDTRRGKNLVGAFHHPVGVLTDPALLSTLDPTEWRNGLGEVLKYALLGALPFSALGGCDHPQAILENESFISDVIIPCLQLKADLCSCDEKDTGVRLRLNLGHTLGHALEAAGNYQQYRHGEAVALGLIGETAIAEELGIADPGLTRKIEQMAQELGLATRAPILNPEIVASFLGSDKKNAGEGIRFVLLRKFGETEIVNVEDETLIQKALARITQDDEGLTTDS